MSTSNKLFQAASGGAGESVYVDDVFSTYLYTGTNPTTLAIDNGIDFAGEGGLLWIKRRDGSRSHRLWDTERGRAVALQSDKTDANGLSSTATEDLISFNSNGFTLGVNAHYGSNNLGQEFCSWSFRKQAGFFDVVTYTGDGTSSRDIAHNLGSKPGFIITKRTNLAGNWTCYHQALGYEERIYLDLTNAKSTNSATWVQEPTATHFTVGSENTSGSTYVAYIFAHDDQSFGDDSDEAIIKCGSYTGGTDGSVFVDLGFEPQFLILKKINGSSHWAMIDTMRGLNANQGVSPPTRINANESDAENTTGLNGAYVAANGFYPWGNGGGDWNDPNGTYIYIAIRRPMKTPESGTEVFTPNSYSGNSTADRTLVSSNSPVDLGIVKKFNGNGDWLWSDRLRGAGQTLYSNYTQAESVANPPVYITGFDLEDGMEVGSHLAVNASGNNYISYMFTRAAGFFDVVAYTGNSTGNTAITHNLGVVPEIIITKPRNGADNWAFWHKDFTQSQVTLLHNTLGVVTNSNYWGSSTPTATNFYVQTDGATNYSGYTYIAYLFATVAGVSKVGSYTGTGSDINVDCGFTSGARFILIKRTDSTGDWYTYDSERGIVAGNDPYVLINSQSGEVTSTDYIDPLSSGFTVTSSAPAALNASGGTYIFLAIAQVQYGIQSTFKR